MNHNSFGLYLKEFKIFSGDAQRGELYGVDGTEFQISPGDYIGFGYVFATSEAFFTYNGVKLPSVSAGIGGKKHDMYAAIGVEGANVLEVNFGTDRFVWAEGNEEAWRIDWTPIIRGSEDLTTQPGTSNCPRYASNGVSPPGWTPNIKDSYEHGLYSDATHDEFESAKLFCARHSVDGPKPLPEDTVEILSQKGCGPWQMKLPQSHGLKGQVGSRTGSQELGVIKVVTEKGCESTCIFSNLPIIAGSYDIVGKKGVYYEVVVKKMKGVIAIGNSSFAHPTRPITHVVLP